MNVWLKQIEASDLAELWAVAYGPKADLEWKKWDGPYFKDPVLSWADFATGWGKDCVDNPMRKANMANNQIVGIVTAYWEDGQLRRWLDMGIALYDHTYWGQGVGTKALSMWVSELFDRYLHVQHLGFTTWSGNIGMQKLGEGIGMVQEARIRKVRFWQNEYFDSIKYGLLREEWLAKKQITTKLLIGSEAYLQAASHYLRYDVFVLEKGIAKAVEFAEKEDASTIYCVLFQGERPVATARLLHSKTARIGRVATSKQHRKMGYGRLVVQALERYASELGYKEVELHAELTAVPFYKKMAYQPVGTVYQEDGIPCQTMKKRII